LSDYAVFPKEVVYLYKQQEHTILNDILTSAPISNCIMFTLKAMTIDGVSIKLNSHAQTTNIIAKSGDQR